MDEVLEKWYETKEKIESLKEKLEKYRNLVIYEMEKKGDNKVENKVYVAQRKKMKKNYVSKDSLPSDIWKKYSISVNYETITIRKKKNNLKINTLK